ncbi:MAG: 3,4-dihydroxy-2-butanone-4-phosphate synthase, partial [Rickettsiales bacterium]|nr:3,4-dihydroxy-2-butanone-4-phosphate synthase [Rickettsiales bacterium]
VICEIMKDDGTMARLPDLIEFAKIHNLNIATIADLIEYRRKKEKLVEKSFESEIEIDNFGKFNLHLFKSVIEYGEHLALVKGDISGGLPILTRMHKLDVLSDILKLKNSNKKDILYKSLDLINKNGSGVLVILRSPDKQSLSKSLENLLTPKNAKNSSQPSNQLRDYGIGAQILLDLGVRKLKIITSGTSITPVAMEGYDLEIVEEIRI